MSKKREEMRQRRQRQYRQRQLTVIGVIAVIAIAVAGWLAYQNLRPLGAIIPIATEAFPGADGKALGPVGAKALIQEFADFQCPFCARYASSVEPLLLADYLTGAQAPGNVRYEYHHFVIIDQNVGGHESQSAAEASECAAEQGQFWNYHKLLFTNQQTEGSGTYSDRRLKAFAGLLSLNQSNFDACFDSHKYASAVNADKLLAQQLGINSTPSLFINGVQVTNPLDYTEIKQRLDLVLQ
ncbi:MAG: thioredoxin domain-containing protein, partial [Anaerolineales bacterium]